ncbi:MAG: thiamine phosphate synthase [Thermodesulfobacteriota bacterium]|nr:MAG: thiamine phosphate synthase [Thermodesulfobacteriota bacterium]
MKNSHPTFISGLYAIVDSAYVSLERAGECADELASGGARIVQLRAKGETSGAMLRAALEMRKALAGRAIFIVNDRIDIALMASAEGVHLGQDDIPLKDARRLLPSSVIGVSTHNREEAKKAEAGGADYISFGPIFPTRTKTDADTPKGLSGLKEVSASVHIPVVAIGGITGETIVSVLESGACSAALISDILLAPSIKAKAASISALISRARNHG